MKFLVGAVLCVVTTGTMQAQLRISLSPKSDPPSANRRPPASRPIHQTSQLRVTETAPHLAPVAADNGVASLAPTVTAPVKPPTYDPNTGVPAAFKTYEQVDFVQAKQLRLLDDFAQTPVGEFPARWRTNSMGEIVTLDDDPAHWLALGKAGQFSPEAITDLPDQFTLQFDLACSHAFSFYSTGLYVTFAALTNPANEYTQWGAMAGGDRGVTLLLHPMNAAGRQGMSELTVRANREPVLHREKPVSTFWALGRNIVTVSICRQQQRLRVYVNEEKVWDVPEAFQPGVPYNSLVFGIGAMHRDEDSYYLGNLRFAVGDPAMQQHLRTEGRCTAGGIQFEPGDATLKPIAYASLKEVADWLTQAPQRHVQIVCHTNSDGDEQANRLLAKRRADVVRAALVSQFAIRADRLTTDGQGEAQPIAPNDTPEGRATNQRVEFIVSR
ncbi:Outer membrane porin F [Fibrella aestuarina BUZ 2]|uniref:Outer membrane porin F n=1 Tax=Fibrella aestuarina BUZ 2 TaxID=1166018 RepID=I0KH51_9BACT|nr:OmpA family protein [Fibrella aestuarina]CCH03454.1 Outer membrane porin F [Fibrella aestuarina BUZ 2]